MLLLSVAQKFYPLPSVEGDLAERLSRLYFTEDSEGPNVSVCVCVGVCVCRCMCACVCV